MAQGKSLRIGRGLGLAALGLAIAAVAAPQAPAATLTPLASFNGGDGANPEAGLIADTAGNLFGTTVGGGAHGAGTVFEIARTATGYAATPTVLVSFCAQAVCADGANPEAGLIAGAAGNLFGTTFLGGAHGQGTVFEIAKTATGYAGTPTVLVSFSGADGSQPVAGLIADTAGNLFGTTLRGGAVGLGTVFEIGKTASGYAGTPTVLASFCAQAGCTDGRTPVAGLIADTAGNLFGTTPGGGANNSGTVFEIARTATGYAGTPTVLVSFCAQTSCTDGNYPDARLVADAAGNLFGTTEFGGANGQGTMFEIARTATGYADTPTVLVSFCAQANCADGATPVAGLIADAAGNLFGTTVAGGAHGGGTVFAIAKTATGYAGTPTVLVSFCALAVCADGAEPAAGLIAGVAGNLFGTTAKGGASDVGTVFEVAGSGFVVPAAFVGTPGLPSCHGKSVSTLAMQYGGLAGAADALNYANVHALQNAISLFCGG